MAQIQTSRTRDDMRILVGVALLAIAFGAGALGQRYLSILGAATSDGGAGGGFSVQAATSVDGSAAWLAYRAGERAELTSGGVGSPVWLAYRIGERAELTSSETTSTTSSPAWLAYRIGERSNVVATSFRAWRDFRAGERADLTAASSGSR